MPKIVVTLEYESEEALKRIAEGEDSEYKFISVEDYLSRELGWIMESGFSAVGIEKIAELPGKVKKVCAKCGSEDINFDAYATWNFETQCFEVAVVFDKEHICEGKCKGPCKVTDVPVV